MNVIIFGGKDVFKKKNKETSPIPPMPMETKKKTILFNYRVLWSLNFNIKNKLKIYNPFIKFLEFYLTFINLIMQKYNKYMYKYWNMRILLFKDFYEYRTYKYI